MILAERTIEAAFPWTQPKVVETKLGPRIKRWCKTSVETMKFWKAHQTQLSAAGIMCVEYPEKSGEWAFVWWKKLASDIAEHQKKSLALSKANDYADIEIPMPPGITLRGYQKAGIAFMAMRTRGLIGDDMGLGKRLLHTTPVLTPTGWTQIGQLKVGDIVVGGSDGKSCKVTGVFRQNFQKSLLVKFNDGCSVEAGPEHLWNVRDANDRYRKPGMWRTMSTEQIAANFYQIGIPRWEIPFVQSQFEEFDFCINPYLVGVLLGNGGIASTTPRVHTRHPEQLVLIKPMLPGGIEIKGPYRSDPCAYALTGSNHNSHIENPLAASLREIGMWGKRDFEKVIPEQFLWGSVDQRLALLQGLLDTDGTTSGGRTRFNSCSEILANQVAWIIRSLGGWSDVSVVAPRPPRSPRACYFVSVQLPEHLTPFRLKYHKDRFRHPKHRTPRVIESISDAGDKDMVCIAVDDPKGLYVVNDFIVTHNTPQAIGLINHFNHRAGKIAICRVLIIVPANLMPQWCEELRKFLVHSYSIGTVDGKTFPTSDIVIIAYTMLHKWEAKLSNMWDMVILDEVQAIRNPNTRMCKAVIGYRPKRSEDPSLARSGIPAKRAYALTGTPGTKRVKDIWPVLTYLDPITWNDYGRFAWLYCGGSESGKWTDQGVSNSDQLQSILRSTIMVRRLKADVLSELPPKTRIVIVLKSEEQLNLGFESPLFQKFGIKSWFDRMAKAKADVEIAKCFDDMRAYQLAKDALEAAVDSGSTATVEVQHKVGLAKLPLVESHLLTAIEECGKIVVFAYHRDVLEGLHKMLPKSVLIYGGITPADRFSRIHRFQNDPGVEAIIVQVKTAAGMNLTAASRSFFVERSWNPGDISQAEDRIHRIGQEEDKVFIYHFVLENSIDGVITQSIMTKQEMLEKAFDKSKVDVEEGFEPIVPMPGFQVTRKAISDKGQSIAHEETMWAVEQCRVIFNQKDKVELPDWHLAGALIARNFTTRRLRALAFLLAQGYKHLTAPIQTVSPSIPLCAPEPSIASV